MSNQIRYEKFSDVVERFSPGPLHSTTANELTGVVPIISQSETGFVGFHDGTPGVEASPDKPVVTFANHTCAVRWHESPFSTIQNVFPLRGYDGIVDTGYLYWFLKQAISPSFYGGHWPMLVDKPVPVPPIEKQRQIATRLKAQLAEVDKVRQAAEGQLRDAAVLVTRYRENAIKKLDNVPRVPLGELLVGIEAGKSFQTTELIARPDELGVLKVSAVSWNEFLPQEAKAIESEYQPDERHKIKKGDLIISRANTLELVGAVVLVDDDYPMRLLSDKTLRLVVNEEKALPDYLLTVLKLPEARLHIENNATGTSDSMRNISQKTINSIPIPVLTVDKQRELINRFSKFNEEIVLIQKSGNEMINDINLLPQKILAQAFEGVKQ